MSKLTFVSEYKPEKEKTLYELADKYGVDLNISCGKGKCGKCKVEILEGACEPATKEELKTLKTSELESGVRLACCCVPKGDVVVKLSK